MRPEKCVETLLDASNTVEKKATALDSYLRWHESIGRNMRVGVYACRAAAARELSKAAQDGGAEDVEKRVRASLNEIAQYKDKRKAERNAGVKARIAELRRLPSGTAIVINNEGNEDVVNLVEVKRTRFICEYEDGRLFNVPAELFIRIHEGTPPIRLTVVERENRELVRALSGRHNSVAREQILTHGSSIVPALLDELEAALTRIENAPVGLSQGALRNAIGPVKKINPRDQALVKRIPVVVKEITTQVGTSAVEKLLDEHRNSEVRRLCQRQFSSKVA